MTLNSPNLIIKNKPKNRNKYLNYYPNINYKKLIKSNKYSKNEFKIK
jgi:hypothetical protein